MNRTLFVFLVLFTAGIAPAKASDVLRLSARAWVLMDQDSGYILSQNNEYLPLHPGDLSKLMSAYVLFQRIRQGQLRTDEHVTVNEEALAVNGARIFLKRGDTPEVNLLLAAMLVHSANDATVALADHSFGSQQGMVDEMNRQAHVLSMNRSHFRNVTGLPDRQQAVTAADLALLAQATARQFPQHQDLFRIRKIHHHGIDHHNRNALLWRDERVGGMMVSLNRHTGYHMVASARVGDMKLLAIVLGATNEQQLFRGAQSLFDYGFHAYDTRLLYPTARPLAQTPVPGGASTEVAVGTGENLYVTLPRGTFGELQALLNIEPSLPAPVANGQEAGSLRLIYRNKEIATHPLVALEDIGVGNALQQAWGRFRAWMRNEPDAPDDDEAGVPAPARQ